MNPPSSRIFYAIFIFIGQSYTMPASQLNPTQFVLPGKDLQPNKCFKKTFREPINIEGCNPVFFENNYCFGSCNSFYIPSYKDSFNFCKACMPSKYKKIDMTFTCMRNGEEQKEIKTLNVIQDCKCMDVSCTKKR